MTRVYPGQTVISRATFVSDDGLPIDPDTITMKTRTPAGVQTTYSYPSASISKVSDGIYDGIIDIETEGAYFLRWEGVLDDTTSVNETKIVGVDSPF